MSGVKRWDHVTNWGDHLQITSTMMGLSDAGKYVLASDYDTLLTANQRLEVDAARLDFMLDGYRKVVLERLPSRDGKDRMEIYVEEGFMGDKRYPAVAFSGDWGADPAAQLEIKRRAIDAALAGAGGAE